MQEAATLIAGGKSAPSRIHRRTCRVAFRVGVAILTIGVNLVACSSDQVSVWSTQVSSPDRQWNAVGRTNQYTGPGNAAVITAVYLRRAGGSTPEQLVLDFFDDFPPGKGGIEVALRWLSPTHLDISLSRSASLKFELVKFADVDISVRVSAGAPNTS